MSLFEEVKLSITVPEAAQRYGLTVHRGRGLCPFHDDHHPSLMIREDHYHCFTCGAHGDVIDLAGKLLNLSPGPAARTLAVDFGIRPGTVRVPRPVKKRNLREEKSRCLVALTGYLHWLRRWKQEEAPDPGQEPGPRFLEACQMESTISYLTDALLEEEDERLEKTLDILKQDGKIEWLEGYLQEIREEYNES